MQVQGAKNLGNGRVGQKVKGSPGRWELARKRPAFGWWEQYHLPYAEYLAYEWAAVRIHDFEPGVFPGLLQTPDYAFALHERAYPRLPEGIIQQRIEVRRRRQQVLDSHDTPKLDVILDEAVLHRVVGGREVMAQQLAHVVQASKRDHISVRVIPYSAGAHAAMDSTFTLLEFEQPQPSVIYVEGLAGRSCREEPEVAEFYQEVLVRLNELALSEDDSVEIMIEARAEILAKVNS